MLFSQYCRLERYAGGLGCTDKEFIKACRRVMASKSLTRDSRDVRHAWIRLGLIHLHTNQDMIKQYRL